MLAKTNSDGVLTVHESESFEDRNEILLCNNNPFKWVTNTSNSALTKVNSASGLQVTALYDK